MARFGRTGGRVMVFGKGGGWGGCTGKLALSMASPPDLPSHQPDLSAGLQVCPSQLCSHQTKVPRLSFPLRTPPSPVNQGHWWFPGVTCPDSGGPVCPSHLNSFSGTGFPQAVLTLTQKPLSSSLRTLSVPGDSDLCQHPLHLA